MQRKITCLSELLTQAYESQNVSSVSVARNSQGAELAKMLLCALSARPGRGSEACPCILIDPGPACRHHCSLLGASLGLSAERTKAYTGARLPARARAAMFRHMGRSRIDEVLPLQRMAKLTWESTKCRKRRVLRRDRNRHSRQSSTARSSRLFM